MSNWQIVLLHTRPNTLLKRIFEAAFPGQVTTISVPLLGRRKYWHRTELLDYFRRYVHDPSIWDSRVLTLYGSGEFHQYTYALSRLACERRKLHNFDWTYFHFDNHRDDWGIRDRRGWAPNLMCANFVDSLVYDNRGIPFFVGPVVYANKDSRGYKIRGTEIPIYHNQFPKSLQQSQDWKGTGGIWGWTDPRKLPTHEDLASTPTDAYATFDLDLLDTTEIVTNFDQSEVKLRDLCRQVDRVREHKRLFSADILGLPDNCQHALSALTVLILARKLMGLGVERFLRLHDQVKFRQRGWIRSEPELLKDKNRRSPLSEGELLEELA